MPNWITSESLTVRELSRGGTKPNAECTNSRVSLYGQVSGASILRVSFSNQHEAAGQP
jgi:hypothetical protein